MRPSVPGPFTYTVGIEPAAAGWERASDEGVFSRGEGLGGIAAVDVETGVDLPLQLAGRPGGLVGPSLVEATLLDGGYAEEHAVVFPGQLSPR